MLAKKDVGAHGSRSTRTETLPASVLLDIVLPVYKERFTRWDGPLDSFRGESLSFRIRLSVMAIANFRIFSDSPPISDRSFSLLSFIDRASDKNLIPIQFGPRWCRFRRIKVWFMVVIIAKGGGGKRRLICIPASRGMWRGNGARVSYNRVPPRARSRLVSSDFAACSTTLITPAARSTGVVYDLSFRRYGITNPCSISSAKHVPRFSCRHFTNRLVRPRTRSSFPFRREHGMELAIIYPGRPIYFFADRK